jgi:hypothetical protein
MREGIFVPPTRRRITRAMRRISVAPIDLNMNHLEQEEDTRSPALHTERQGRRHFRILVGELEGKPETCTSRICLQPRQERRPNAA